MTIVKKMYRDDSTTLFVGNLSVFATPLNLQSHFEQFGTILEIRMRPGNGGQPNCGFCFIQFRSHAAAVGAIASLHGTVFMGRIIRCCAIIAACRIVKCIKYTNKMYLIKYFDRVQWATSNRRTETNLDFQTTARGKENSSAAQVMVSFACRKPVHMVNEEELRSVFSRFGAIVDVSIKKNGRMQVKEVFS